MFTYRKERTPYMQRKNGSILLYQTVAFLMAEKERFSHNAASGIACTVATKAFALPRPTELGRQKPSCRHSKNLPSSATGGGRFFSLSHRCAVRGSNLAPPTKKATLLGGNVALITHLVVKYRAKQALLALLQLRLLLSLALRSLVGKSQVAATRSPPSPSHCERSARSYLAMKGSRNGSALREISHRYAVRDSNLAPPTQKGHPIGHPF